MRKKRTKYEKISDWILALCSLNLVRKWNALWLMFLSIIPILSSQADYQFYRASLEKVSWSNSGNRLECRMSQNIPGYGKAVFKQRATRPLVFQVVSNLIPRKSGSAMLYVAPPEWKRYAHTKVLGRIPLSAQKNVLVLPQDWAYRVAFELGEGMQTVWTHPDWVDGQDLVTVKILPLHFLDSWQEFIHCGENLIDYTYGEVKFTEFYFEKNNTGLSPTEKSRLNELAEYVSLEPNIKQIKISSFSDSRGVRRLNLAVSRKRALAVRDYLIQKGVNKNKFVIVAQGEKKPKYNNRTPQGRAKNRRVEVSLVK